MLAVIGDYYLGTSSMPLKLSLVGYASAGINVGAYNLFDVLHIDYNGTFHVTSIDDTSVAYM